MSQGANAIDPPISHHNNILAFDRDWQYPAQTERHAFRQLARLGCVPEGDTYIAYPWANLIDKVDTRAADAAQHLRDFHAFRQLIPPQTHAPRLDTHLSLARASGSSNISPITRADSSSAATNGTIRRSSTTTRSGAKQQPHKCPR